MKEMQSWNPPALPEPIPGCMGRMVNIFGSSAGMAGTKMLTERPHGEGEHYFAPGFVPGSRPRSPKSAADPVSSPINDRPVSYDARRSSPARRSAGGTPMKMLIAHEMSKETENKQKPPGVVARLMGLDALPGQQPATNQPNAHLHQLSGETPRRAPQETQCLRKSTQPDTCKDVYEVWPPQQPLPCERRMDLVRQKFMEAKRLATDQRLLQSKEFQDALEVLSSNRDLFLKFLEEPNSLFSHNLQELRTPAPAAPPPAPKRITVLKPSKAVDPDNGDRLESSRIGRGSAFVVPQPTRIVVLKPSPRKAPDLELPSTGGFSDGRRDDLEGSRDVAKEITRQIRESLGGNRRDDTLLSSVLSNGYIGDESSFNRSEKEFIMEEDDPGNYTDSELVSPTSRFSWDHGHRFGSPFSLSSVSRASYSPESSVIREAKKRLSERWAVVASGGSSREQHPKQVRRSSSTLGEMLSIPEKKEDSDDGRDPDAAAENESPRKPKLLRSKSVPSSSSFYDAGECAAREEKAVASKDHDRPRSGRTLFKGKVSSLFSKSKKPSRGKADAGRNEKNGLPDDLERGDDDPTPQNDFSCRSSSPAHAANRGAALNSKTKVVRTGETNGEQPSPISVLAAPFEEELNSSSSHSSDGAAILDCRQLISRSPPIESVARSLSRSQPKLSRTLSLEEEHQETYSFLKSLFDSAGLGGDAPSSVAAPLARWHSLDSPLDPSLLDKFLERKYEDAKCRERRSNQRLLFDAANAALLDIGRAAGKSGGAAQPVAGSVVEEVWRRVKGWWSVGVDPPAGENCGVAADRVLRMEVAGCAWGEMMSSETEEIGKGIEVALLEELVGETMFELVHRRPW